MTAYFGEKVKPDKGAALVERIAPLLLPGERVHLMLSCNQLRPSVDRLVVTSHRLIGTHTLDKRILFELPYTTELAVESQPDKDRLTVSTPDRSVTFKSVPRADHPRLLAAVDGARADTDPETVRAAYAEREQQERDTAAAQNRERADRAQARTAERQARAAHRAAERAARTAWPHSDVVGGQISAKASDAVRRLCDPDDPWLILVPVGSGGVLAAWEDRLAIVKTGAWTSLMAGSFGGERTALFHYRDITGIEYNAGLMNGVLEILTPSYNGTAHHDYWRGSNASRNADSGDPWTLSNTLPLAKHEYRAAQAQLSALRNRISKAKEVVVQVSPAYTPPPGDDMADQLRRLAELRDAGTLSDEEFTAAKQRLIYG
jgi:hypothetical protein